MSKLGKYWQVDILYAAKDDEEVEDTASDKKNPSRIYFVVFVEKLSRWVEIIPIFNLSEDEVFRAMIMEGIINWTHRILIPCF